MALEESLGAQGEWAGLSSAGIFVLLLLKIVFDYTKEKRERSGAEDGAPSCKNADLGHDVTKIGDEIGRVKDLALIHGETIKNVLLSIQNLSETVRDGTRALRLIDQRTTEIKARIRCDNFRAPND